jgi:hypothetical protein
MAGIKVTAGVAGVAGGLAGAYIGAFLGSLFLGPGTGTAIGATLLTITGGLLTTVTVESKLKSRMCRDVELYDEFNIKTNHTPSPKELYLNALEGFGLKETSSNEEVKYKKRVYLLLYHPDKNPSTTEES